jgi:phage tail sheath protein FI
MAEYLSPGIFLEEVPSVSQTITGVSTSSCGFIGTASMGPVNVCTLVGSYPEYERVFGGMNAESKTLSLSVAAFFANGGSRAFIVRVPRSDAVTADARIQVSHDNEILGLGDAAGADDAYTNLTATGIAGINTGLSALNCAGGFSPLRANSPATPLTLKWRSAGTPLVAAVRLRNRLDTANVTLVAGTADYECVIPAGSMPSYEPFHLRMVPGEVTIEWVGQALVAKTHTFSIPASGESAVTDVRAAGSIVAFDYATGRLSLHFMGTDVPGGAVVGDELKLSLGSIPTTETWEIYSEAVQQVEANPRIYLTEAVPGTILKVAGPGGAAPYNHHAVWTWTGDVLFAVNAGYEPHAYATIRAEYTTDAWKLIPLSSGAWINDFQLTVKGSPNYYDILTGYSKYDVFVKRLNTETSTYEAVEAYEELVFDDPNSANYFPDVINDLSDYVNVFEPGTDEAPWDLNDQAYSVVIGGGDGTAPNKTWASFVIPGFGGSDEIQPLSFRIEYTDASGVARVIEDDGNESLVGDVDSGVPLTNTVDYATGAVAFVTSELLQPGTLVTLYWRNAPATDEHVEQFGDVAKAHTIRDTTNTVDIHMYLAGANGTAALTRGDTTEAAGTLSLETNEQGLYALNQTDELMQVVVPAFPGNITVYGDILDYCEKRRDRYSILVTPSGLTGQQAANWFLNTFKRYSKFAALYWPWVKIADPLANSRPLVFPPFGHIAGIYARTDSTKNVGKSPGGITDGQLRYLIGLEKITTQAERDYVYPRKVNPLIDTPATGRAVWGVRQIALESEWRYINARRLFMFLEKSVFNAMHWVVFENNGQGLWTKIRLQLVSFLNSLFQQGYFAGTSPSEAFFVVCDETNNTQASIDAGLVFVDIGVAPNKPAEFVVFRFQQKASA